MPPVGRKCVKDIRSCFRSKQPPSYIIITCEDDLYMVEDVLKASLPCVYNAEFVLSAVLRGKIDFDIREYITTV